MSLNISSKLLDVAESISVEINVARMGPRQQASFTRMAKEGVCKTSAVPGQVAYAWRASQGLPVVALIRNQIRWNNIPADSSFFDRLTASVVAFKLTEKGNQAHVDKYMNAIEEAAANRSPKGSVWAWWLHQHIAQQLKTLKLAKPATLPPQFIVIDKQFL